MDMVHLVLAQYTPRYPGYVDYVSMAVVMVGNGAIELDRVLVVLVSENSALNFGLPALVSSSFSP